MKESQSQTNLGKAAAGWRAAPAAEMEQPFVRQLLRAQGEADGNGCDVAVSDKGELQHGTRPEDRSAQSARNARVLRGPSSPGVRLPLALAPGVRFTLIRVVSPSSPFSPQGDAHL